MAVTALPRTRTRPAPLAAATLPPLVLLLSLLAPAGDLLSHLQGGLSLAAPSLVAAVLATCALAWMWLRYPRTSWLAAATLGAAASVAMRMVGADVAATGLSLLAILAIGVSGGFANTSRELAECLDEDPRPEPDVRLAA